MKWRSIALRCGLMAVTSVAFAEPGGRENLGKFAIDRTEVTIGQFRKFAADKDLKTAAERLDPSQRLEMVDSVRRTGQRR